MRTGFLVGRIIVALYYIWGGINGLLHLGMMSGYAASHGVPLAGPAVFVAHLLLLFAGVCFLFGWRPVEAVVALVVFLVPVTLFMHAFWAETTQAAQMAQLINFTKNLALLGSTLMFLAIPRPWPYTLRLGAARRTAEA